MCDLYIKCLGHSFLQDMPYFACWHYLSYVKGKVESQLNALTGSCAKESSSIMDFSQGKKNQKNPADFRNRGSLDKDSPGQLPSHVNPCKSPACLPQIKYLGLHSEIMYEPKKFKGQKRSRTYVFADIHLCMKSQVLSQKAAR